MSVSAQSSTSQVVKFNISEVVGAFIPPELSVDIDFKDANNNKILEANEKGIIKLLISNKGGYAEKVIIKIIPEKETAGLIFPFKELATSVEQDSESVVEMPIEGTIDLPTDSLRLNINIEESLGYGIQAMMLLSTYEFYGANFKVIGSSIVDGGRNLRALNDNPDGKLQKGEVVQAFISLQNVGQAVGKNLKYSIYSTDPNVLVMSDSGVEKEIKGTLNDMQIGEVAEIDFRVSPNNQYVHKGDFIPVVINLSEESGRANLVAENLLIPLDKIPEKAKTFKVEANFDKLMAMRKTEIFSSSDKISSNMKIRDIGVAPIGEPIYSDAVAIVLGAEENGYNIAPAPYAARDAEVMAKYFKNSMGIRDVRLYTNRDVTKARLSDIFDVNGELMRSVKEGQTDVFVFYSGHGMPDNTKDGKMDVYLLPYDGRKDMLKERCYSLSRLYSNLNNLNAKSVTVILDACFSGSSRQSVSHAGVSIANTKGISVVLEDMSAKPWETNPNFRLLTSSNGEQTSLGYDQSQSGLFTYYLAIGMQGDADTDKDGVITIKELSDFVSIKVSEAAKQIRNGDQTPQFFGNDNFIMGKIK